VHSQKQTKGKKDSLYIPLKDKNTDFEVVRVDYPKAKLKSKAKTARHTSAAKASISAMKLTEAE
jgi:hypothetical protein